MTITSQPIRIMKSLSPGDTILTSKLVENSSLIIFKAQSPTPQLILLKASIPVEKTTFYRLIFEDGVGLELPPNAKVYTHDNKYVSVEDIYKRNSNDERDTVTYLKNVVSTSTELIGKYTYDIDMPTHIRYISDQTARLMSVSKFTVDVADAVEYNELVFYKGDIEGDGPVGVMVKLNSKLLQFIMVDFTNIS